MSKPPSATFAGYVSEAGRQLVQDWYSSLPDVERDEIADTVNGLAVIPVTEWRRPSFDKVTHPLVEIRCKAAKTNHTIRIYGVFDERIRSRLILLYGDEAKKQSNDMQGQRKALTRLGLLKQNKGSTHEFDF